MGRCFYARGQQLLKDVFNHVSFFWLPLKDAHKCYYFICIPGFQWRSTGAELATDQLGSPAYSVLIGRHSPDGVATRRSIVKAPPGNTQIPCTDSSYRFLVPKLSDSALARECHFRR